MKKQMANLITGCRILCSVGLLWFPVFSSGFLAAYLLCGLSDMVDGTVARKTGAASAFGARLDSAADLIFVACAAVKLLPALELPLWLWAWALLILILKAVNLGIGFAREKRWLVFHTAWNKRAGFLLFLWPLTLSFLPPACSAAAVCCAATIAAVQEGWLIRAGREGV